MKTFFLVMLAVLGSVSARADVVVDNFNCTLNFTSTDGTQNLTSSGQLTAIRLPESPVGQTSPGGLPHGRSRDEVATYLVANAGSDLAATVNGHALTFSLALNYTFAIATDASGAQRAGQIGCLTAGYSIDGSGISAACASAAYDGQDPLEGWTPVPIVDGVPTFDAGILVPNAQAIDGFGTVTASCSYINTNQ